MPGYASDYFRDALNDANFGKPDGDYEAPLTYELRLVLEPPAPDNQVIVELGEGIGYAAVELTNDTTTFNDSVSGFKSTKIALDWGTSLSSWTTVPGAVLYDPEAGKWLLYAPFEDESGAAVPQTVGAGLIVNQDAGNVRISFS